MKNNSPAFKKKAVSLRSVSIWETYTFQAKQEKSFQNTQNYITPVDLEPETWKHPRELLVISAMLKSFTWTF